MAKNAILRILYLLFSLPMILVAVIFYLFDIWSVRSYFQKCTIVVRENNSAYALPLVKCLCYGEDRRNAYHLGVDYFAVLRAIWCIANGKLQGASTIEQQFIRTVIGRYERTLTRKLIEQLLSHLISIKFTKREIAESYLAIAFFGTSMQGMEALCNRLNPQVYDINFYAGVIARLKYPQPKNQFNDWTIKHSKRTEWIERQYYSGNKAFMGDSRPLSTSPQHLN